MFLNNEDSDFFFLVYFPLLYFSYSHFGELTFKDFLMEEIGLKTTARDLLFNNRIMFDEYVNEVSKKTNGPIDKRRLDLISQLKNGIYREFIIVEKLGELYCIDYKKSNNIYKVSGISHEPFELFPNFPCLAKTALFKYCNRIVFDGLVQVTKEKYPVSASKLIIRDFETDSKTMLKDVDL